MGINTVSLLDEIDDAKLLIENIDSIYIELSYKPSDSNIMSSKKVKLRTLSSAFYELLKPRISTDILTGNNTWTGINNFENHITLLSALHALWS